MLRFRRCSLIAFSLFLWSCQSPANLQPQLQESVKTVLEAPAKQPEQHLVNFLVTIPSADLFRTQQTAQATHIKLTITNGTTTVYAAGADGNGFKAIGGLNPIPLAATVADGTNWVATVGLYSNADEGGLIQDFKTAFNVPTAGTVEINLRTYLLGEIIAGLRSINSSKLTSNDLNGYQGFVDTLTGFTPPSTFTTDPKTLSGLHLALLIDNNTISPVNAATAGGLTTSDYKQTPYVQLGYRAPIGDGLLPVSVNPGNGNIFFKNGGGVLMGLQPLPTFNNNGTPGDTSDDQLNQIFAPNSNFTTGANDITSRTIPLGLTTGNIPVMYFLEKNSANTEILRAIRQSDGTTQAWSYTFEGRDSLGNTRFVPVLKRDDNATPGNTADDTDIVYAYLGASIAGEKGIYAVKDGVFQWFYPTGSTTLNDMGALSPDGSTLYVMTNGFNAANFSNLIAINTSNGTLKWTRPFNTIDTGSGGLAPNESVPTVGTDGTVYATTYHQTSNLGYLYSINPTTGAINWTQTLSHRAFKAPIIDRQNGKDVIYVLTKEGNLHAIYQDQILKWSTPASIGSPISADPTVIPLVGQEPDGRRMIFIGMGNQKMYTVRDLGSSGQKIWDQDPGGSFSSGFSLKNGTLYVSTSNGGDGQFILLQALKVLAVNLPADAPWPKMGGNLANTGRRQQDQP